jgi:hypothetical protein
VIHPGQKKLTALSLLAGISYTTWPLGYWLNPVVAHGGLASELAGRGQPYSWVFVYGDVLCGLLMLIVAWRLRLYAKSPGSSSNTRLTLAAMAVFCVGIIVAALIQVQCIAAVQQCPSFTHNFVTLVHGLLSIAAPIGLYLSLLSIWWQRRSSQVLTLQLVLYAGLGSWTLLTLLSPAGILAQNVFITFCAVCLAAYPWSFQYAFESYLKQKSRGL